MTSTSFVVGATGFVGRHLVAQLATRGGATFAHVRPDSPQLEQWRARFAKEGGTTDSTPWEVSAMAERLAELRPAAIYICIGTTQKRAKEDAATGNPYERVDYGLTKVMADAARRASELVGSSDGGYRPRLVYLSSIGADAKARSEYLSWRGKAEEAVRDSGLPWMIAQPSFITESSSAPDGARDQGRPVEKAAAVVGDCALTALALFGARKLRAKYRSTTPDVLAAALIRLGEAPEAGRVAVGDELR